MTFDEYLARLRDMGFKIVNSSVTRGVPQQAWRECIHGHFRYIWLPDTDDPEVLEFEARQAEEIAGHCGHPPRSPEP